MHEFQNKWLNLRETVDRSSRNKRILYLINKFFKNKKNIRTVDLGSGAGSNYRFLKPRLLNNERQQILGVLSKHGGVTYYLEISEKSEFNAFISTVSNDGQEKYGNAFSRDVFNKLNSKSLNRWIHIAFTFNGKSMKLYVDGKLNVDSPVNMPENVIVPWSNNLFIGAKRVSAKNLTESQFSGEIDELYFYNNELTVSEIKQLIDDAPLTLE